MATRCCDHHISCPGAGNLDFDSPFANLSAEAPDIDFYIGINWGWDRNVPRLGSWWTRNSCLGVCESAISQADADACAARNQLICVSDHWDPPPGQPPTDGIPFNGPLRPRRLPLFTNNPETCIASCPDGIGFAFTTPAGQYISSSQILSDRMALSEACRLAVSAKICLSALNPNEVCTGKQYLAVIHATGGTAPMSFVVVAGTVPTGIVLSQGPGDHDLTLAGVPTVGGAYQFTIRCSDAVGHFMQKTFTLSVAGIDQTSLPDASVGTAYSETLTASNMILPFNWAISSGSLPAGLTLNSASGEISGTPTTAETSAFTVSVTDGAGLACTHAYTITVTSSAVCPVADGTATPAGAVPAYPWALYAPTASVLNPHQYFISKQSTIAYVDADTHAVIGTFAVNPAAFPIGDAVFSSALNKIFHICVDGGGQYYIYAFDVDTHAQTRSAGYTPTPLFLAYDSTHNELAARFIDTGGNQILLKRFNAATLAEIASYVISVDAGNQHYYGLSYDSVRDVYWTSFHDDTGPSSNLRSFARLGGAMSANLPLAAQGDGATYVAATDRVYVASDPAHAVWVFTPTPALEATVVLPFGAATKYATYVSARNELILTDQAAGPKPACVAVPANTFVCSFGTAGSATIGVFGSKLGLDNAVGTVEFYT